MLSGREGARPPIHFRFAHACGKRGGAGATHRPDLRALSERALRNLLADLSVVLKNECAGGPYRLKAGEDYIGEGQ